MIPVLLEAVKEQQAEIERLNADVEFLKSNVKVKRISKSKAP